MKDFFDNEELSYILPLPLTRSFKHKHRYLLSNNWTFSHSLNPMTNSVLYYTHPTLSSSPMTIHQAYYRTKAKEHFLAIQRMKLKRELLSHHSS